MSHITVVIPTLLAPYCGGASELDVRADTVRAALDELQRLHPRLYPNVCDETRSVRRHINVFVNHDNVRDREGLATTLKDGDVVTILPAVSGG